MFLQNQTSATGSKYTIFKSPFELRKAIDDAVGEKNAELILRNEIPIVTSCGSGMTAAVVWLGLRLLNVDKEVSLYDEVRSRSAPTWYASDDVPQSWTGYAMRSSSKIEKSA